MSSDGDHEPRICLSLSSSGLVAYANRNALNELRDQIDWMIKSDPKEHFECHVMMTLESDESRFENKKPSNVCVKISEDIRKYFVAESEDECGFELTFMHVEESDLDELVV